MLYNYGVREASERLENAFGIASFMGLGFFVALALLGAVALILPRGERFRMRGSIAFFGLYLTCFIASVIVPDGAIGRKPLAVASVFFLLLGIARALFVLVIDGIFTARLGRPLPRIFRDILQTVIYSGVAVVTLRAAGVDPGSLLTTSALLTAVVGLSLQDTLGNLFAGLSIQAQRPFEVGDFIQYDPDHRLIGRVIEINWRATTLLTNDDVEVIIPNAAIARAAIRNFTKPTEASRRVVTVACPYEVSPRLVRETVLAALDGVPEILREPPPSVIVEGFGPAGIDYAVRFYTRNFQLRDVTDSMVRERVWYALRRARVAIPHPTSEIHVVSRREAPAPNEVERLAATARLLRGVDFLAVLPPASLERLASLVETRVYGAGETVIHQGDPGEELFVVGLGHVSVMVGRDGGSTAEIARLGPGQFFGEMSMMTGEARTATVSTIGECELLVVGKHAFAEVLSMAPELAHIVGEAIMRRQEHLGEHLAARAAKALASTEDDAKTNAFVERVKQFLQVR